MLEFIHLKNVGPAPEMKLDLAPRLNLITGDNGLGKSFLDTVRVVRGESAPAVEHERIDRTLPILNQWECVIHRGEHIRLYREGKINIDALEHHAPFIAAEFRRQGQLVTGND